MVILRDVTIPELTGDMTRLAYIYCPDSYEKDRAVRYPVLYMFDGHNVFFDSHATYGRCWGMKEYMDETQTQMIIVAVECNHGRNNERLMEYAPYSFEDPDFGPIKGLGDIYMEWMVEYLKPMIDREYRTLPDRKYTMICGSSMGGLMSLYAVLRYNHIFSRAACLSASFHFCPDEMDRLIYRSDIDPDTIVYLDYGSEEMRYFKGFKEDYIRICASLIYQDVCLNTRIIPGGTHSEESWGRQIPIFMDTLLYEHDQTDDNESDDDYTDSYERQGA